jgi:hypothetical protein
MCVCIHTQAHTHIHTYRVSGDFVSVLQDLIPEVIPSQKCHMNTGPILNCYGVTYCNSRWFEPYIEHRGHSCVLQHRKFDDVVVFCLLCVHTACFHATPIHGNPHEWGPVTAVANSTDHHDQSICQGSAYTGTPSHAHWNVGCPVTLEVHL